METVRERVSVCLLVLCRAIIGRDMALFKHYLLRFIYAMPVVGHVSRLLVVQAPHFVFPAIHTHWSDIHCQQPPEGEHCCCSH